MNDLSPAQSLCVDCGLCCDGSILADVELAGVAESVAVESLGLETDEEDGRQLLLQPCRGLAGTRCTIYEHRPACCRTFECDLLQRFNRGEVTRPAAVALIGEMRRADPARKRALAEEHFLGADWRDD